MSLTIRPFDPARDSAFLRRCVIELQETERACDPHLPPGESMVEEYVASVHERCRRWEGCIWIAEMDGVQAGAAILYTRTPSTEPDEPPGSYALLSDLLVAPEFRGRSIGARLLDHVEAHARSSGVGVIRLDVMSDNAPALALYHRAEYRNRLLQLEKRFAST